MTLTAENLSTNMLKRKSQNGKSYGIEVDGWEVWVPTSQVTINAETGLFSIEFKGNHSFKLQKYNPNRNQILNASEFLSMLTIQNDNQGVLS